MNDDDLVERIKLGDEKAAEELIKRYYASILRYYSNILDSIGDIKFD